MHVVFWNKFAYNLERDSKYCLLLHVHTFKIKLEAARCFSHKSIDRYTRCDIQSNRLQSRMSVYNYIGHMSYQNTNTPNPSRHLILHATYTFPFLGSTYRNGMFIDEAKLAHISIDVKFPVSGSCWWGNIGLLGQEIHCLEVVRGLHGVNRLPVATTVNRKHTKHINDHISVHKDIFVSHQSKGYWRHFGRRVYIAAVAFFCLFQIW